MKTNNPQNEAAVIQERETPAEKYSVSKYGSYRDDIINSFNEGFNNSERQVLANIEAINVELLEKLEKLAFFDDEYQTSKCSYSVAQGYWVDERNRRIEAAKALITKVKGQL